MAKHLPVTIWQGMSHAARIFLIVLLAVFAAGTVAHTAGAAGMIPEMVFGGTASGDCSGCSGEDADFSVCNQACEGCAASFTAMPVGAELSVFPVFFASGPAMAPSDACTGISGSPDPHPPRSRILI